MKQNLKQIDRLKLVQKAKLYDKTKKRINSETKGKDQVEGVAGGVAKGKST